MEDPLPTQNSQRSMRIGRFRGLQVQPSSKRPRKDKDRPAGESQAIKGLGQGRRRINQRYGICKLKKSAVKTGQSGPTEAVLQCVKIGVSQLTAKVWYDRRQEQGFTSDDEFAWWLLRAASNFEYSRTWPAVTTQQDIQLDDRRSNRSANHLLTKFSLTADGANSTDVSGGSLIGKSRAPICSFHQRYSSSFSVLSAKPDDVRHCFRCGSKIKRRLSKSDVLHALVCRRGHCHHVTLELAMGYEKLCSDDSTKCSLCTLWPCEEEKTAEFLSIFINSTTRKGSHISEAVVDTLVDETQDRQAPKASALAPPATVILSQPYRKIDSTLEKSSQSTNVAVKKVFTAPRQPTSWVTKCAPPVTVVHTFSEVKLSAPAAGRPLLRQLLRKGHGSHNRQLIIEQKVAAQPVIREHHRSDAITVKPRQLPTLRPKPPVSSDHQKQPFEVAPGRKYNTKRCITPKPQAALLQMGQEHQESVLRVPPDTQNNIGRKENVNVPITFNNTVWSSCLRRSEYSLKPLQDSIAAETKLFPSMTSNVSPMQVVEVKMLPREDGSELESCVPIVTGQPRFNRFKSILKLRVDEEPKESLVVGSSTDVSELVNGLQGKSETTLESTSIAVTDVEIFEPIIKMELEDVEDERNISDLSEDELERVNEMCARV